MILDSGLLFWATLCIVSRNVIKTPFTSSKLIGAYPRLTNLAEGTHVTLLSKLGSIKIRHPSPHDNTMTTN